MYLKEVTLNGFKSFAKKTELEFSTPITAIVGPNGSGKSNVAEAFRFVLGEQSLKSLRGKRGEDLIFGGTKVAARANRAQVSVTLDNPERDGSKVFPVDFDEIKVARTVYRDGQNEYTLNDGRVRLKDIQEILAAANIGPSGHHIISQGEADRILSAGLKDRREMIEDALGLKIYQFKRAEARRKLEQTETNIAQVESLRREVAPHFKFLERQIKKIERLVALKEKLKVAYAEYLKREDVYLSHYQNELFKSRQSLEKNIADLDSKLAAAKESLVATKEDARRDELLKLEEQMNLLRSEFRAASRQSGQFEGQILLLKKCLADKQKASAESQNIVINRAAAEQLIINLIDRVTKAKARNSAAELQSELDYVIESLKRFSQDIKAGNPIATIETEMAELSELTKEKIAQDERLAELTKKEADLVRQHDQLKLSMESRASENLEVERTLFNLVTKRREEETEFNDIDRCLTLLERDRNEFKRELQEAVELIGSATKNYLNFVVVDDKSGSALSPEAIVSESRDKQHERQRELEKMKIRLEELGGVGEDIEKEYREVKERDRFLERELTDLNQSIAKLTQLITDLTIELNEQFTVGIKKINTEFNRFFRLMFDGGEATLELIKLSEKKNREVANSETEADLTADTEKLTTEGIEVKVKLPNKRVKGLEMLSGGERALTSIALIFAMSQVNPPLFVILDETDAALDEANSRRYGDMIESLAKHSQLILITHNRETMSRASILYGVTMGDDGASKLLSVKFAEAALVSK